MVNDVWIPPGLLQGITNGPYGTRSRRDASDMTARGWVTEILAEGPHVAVIRSLNASPEPGSHIPLQTNAALALTLPSFPLPTASTLTPFQQALASTYDQNRKGRSRSIDYANLHHGHFENVLQPLPDVFTSGQRRRAASITVGSLQRGHVQINSFVTRGDVSRGVSPTMLDIGTVPLQGIATTRSRVSPSPVSKTDQIHKMPLTEKRISNPTAYVSPLLRSSSSVSPTTDEIPDAIQPSRLRFDDNAMAIPYPQRTSISNDNEPSTLRKASVAIMHAVKNVVPSDRRSSIRVTYENAKLRQKQLQRSKLFMFFFQYAIYFLIIGFVYFVLVGRPLWGGTVWYIYVLFENYLTIPAGSAVFIGLATFYAFGPLLVSLEKPAPPPIYFKPHPAIRLDLEDTASSCDCALLIPCYKSEKILPATLNAALEIFPAENIFIINNANTPTPPDNTEAVCTQYGVNHVWCPVGSKLVAQYVGCHVAKSFPYVLMIDDDCALPPNFPIHTSRLKNHVKVLGYTIKSTGPNSSRGSWCQQAQDLEYKLSGIQRQFAGSLGSATFPHGAISLWDRAFLADTFAHHPGFSVSEDWFFGHVARTLGSRILMCSSVFVETETPASLFFAPRSENRGGFGEMTVFKQRFSRWNFFFVNGMYWNMRYILFSWKLGFFHEFGAKLFVFQEVYEAFLYIMTPIIFPISFMVRPFFTLWLFLATAVLYLLNTVLFNEIHLRRRNERVNGWVVVFYYTFFKLCMVVVNCLSTWWSIWKYARYFAQRHPKVVEDERSVGVVLRMEEEQGSEESYLSTIDEKLASEAVTESHSSDMLEKTLQTLPQTGRSSIGRRLTITPMKIEVIPDLTIEADDEFVTEHDLERGKTISPPLEVIEEVPEPVIAAIANKPQPNSWWKPKPTPGRHGKYIPGQELIDHHGIMQTTSDRYGIKTSEWERF